MHCLLTFQCKFLPVLENVETNFTAIIEIKKYILSNILILKFVCYINVSS